jgi:MoaA/NifB/PqqE/SkfB family radical SAM enzyme
MISYVKSKGLVASLVTNGTLLKERAEELVSLGIDNIVVSIDGPADIHDAIRGHPGTFGRASSGMTAVAGVKKKQGKTKPRMRVNCTITGKNYNYISQVVEIAKSLGADSLVYSHLWFWDKAIVERHNASFSHLVKTTPQNARALEGIDVETLSREVNEVRLKTKEFPIQFLPDLNPEQIKVFYQNTTQFLKTRCLYPWLVTMIMPNGDLIPCLDYPLGIVRKEKFTNVWNNQRYRQFRIALKKEGVFPGCARCCGLFSF